MITMLRSLAGWREDKEPPKAPIGDLQAESTNTGARGEVFALGLEWRLFEDEEEGRSPLARIVSNRCMFSRINQRIKF